MPVKRCQYKGCETKSTMGIPLHRFPKDYKRCMKWVAAAKNPELQDKDPVYLNRKAMLCNRHFLKWCFMNDTAIRLTHNAVPDEEKPLALTQFPIIVTYNSIRDEENHFEPSKVSAPTNEAVEDALDVEVPTSRVSAHDSASDEHSQTNGVIQDALDIEVPNSNPPLDSHLPKSSKVTKKISFKNTLFDFPAKSTLTKSTQTKASWRFVKRKKMTTGEKINDLYEKMVSYGVSTTSAKFLTRQIELNLNKKNGKRFLPQEKVFAYALNCISKKAYHAISKLISLPCDRSLRSFAQNQLKHAQPSGNVLNTLKDYVNTSSEDGYFSSILNDMFRGKEKEISNGIYGDVSTGEAGKEAPVEVEEAEKEICYATNEDVLSEEAVNQLCNEMYRHASGGGTENITNVI